MRALCSYGIGIAALASVALAGVAVPAFAADKVVNVYNWSDYIDPSVLKEFTDKTGIKVVYDVFDSNDILETKLLSGGSGYDVVVPSGNFLARQIQAGVFQKLDKAAIPNLSHMWPEIMAEAAKFDPGNDYSVNYMWGTVGIGYNKDKVAAVLPNAPTDSWALIFDPANASKLASCGIQILDAADDTIPAALNYLGMDPDSKKPEDLQKAGELWMKVRPYIQKFHSSEYINALANGDICVAVGYSGDVFQSRNRAADAKNGVNIEYKIPKEGAHLWVDQMAVPADAPHPAEAMAFINFIQTPEVIAKASDFVFYANGNKDSWPFMNKEILNDPAIYPPEDVMKRLYVVTPYPPASQRVLNRVWTSVKSGGQ